MGDKWLNHWNVIEEINERKALSFHQAIQIRTNLNEFSFLRYYRQAVRGRREKGRETEKEREREK